MDTAGIADGKPCVWSFLVLAWFFFLSQTSEWFRGNTWNEIDFLRNADGFLRFREGYRAVAQYPPATDSGRKTGIKSAFSCRREIPWSRIQYCVLYYCQFQLRHAERIRTVHPGKYPAPSLSTGNSLCICAGQCRSATP